MGGIGFVLALVLSAFFTSGASSPVSEDVEGAYKTGSYTATADGLGGPIEVTVEIGSNGGITDVTIKGDKETPDIGGATNQRIHAPEDGSGVGAYLVTALLKKMDELGIKVMYNTKATDLLSLEGTVNGVMAESDDTYYTIHSKAVILATGGFGNNQEMIVRYRDDLEGTVTTGAPGIMGDGIVMAQAVGADLVDIDQIQLHPTV